MAETLVQYKIDYKEPDNLKSEVPGEQILRGSNDVAPDTAVGISTLEEGIKVENPENYVLSPVVTITKNEATYTKGDMKLQKVSVTENVSVIRNGVYHTLKADSYPPVHSTVPPEQTIRMDPEGRKTRIPMRFKQAANRVRRERSMPNRVDGEITLPAQPRRSSIPRLKKPTLKPEEEEFDKIYGEIVDSSIDIDVSLLNNKVEDPVKVENSFEDIVHDYDEGILRPISVEKPVATKIPTVAVKTPVAVNTDDQKPSTFENVKTVHKQTDSPIEKTTKDIKPISAEKRRSIDNSVSVDRSSAIAKPRRTGLEKSSSIDTHATTDKVKSDEKPPSIDKPKSRIPMLKRKSEPEIEVPKSITTPKNVLGNRMRVQDAVSKFSKDEDKAKKIPTRIAVSKKVIDNDNLQGTYQRTISKTTGDGEKYEVKTEEIKVSYETKVEPKDVAKEAIETPTIEEAHSVEIVEITPEMESLQTPSYYEVSIDQPSFIEFEAPLTAPYAGQNNQMYFQDVTESYSSLVETTEVIPNDKSHKDESVLKLSPIKVVTIEEVESKESPADTPKITKEERERLKKEASLMNDYVDLVMNSNENPLTGEYTDPYSRDNINNNNLKKDDTERENTEEKQVVKSVPVNVIGDFDDSINKSQDMVENLEKNDNIAAKKDDDSILRGKVSKMISKLRSKDENSIKSPEKNVFGNRRTVQDVISGFSKDDDKTIKTSRIAISKKIVVDDDIMKGTYHSTISKSKGDEEKFEIKTENIEFQVSRVSSVAPEDITKEAIETPYDSKHPVLGEHSTDIFEIKAKETFVSPNNCKENNDFFSIEHKTAATDIEQFKEKKIVKPVSVDPSGNFDEIPDNNMNNSEEREGTPGSNNKIAKRDSDDDAPILKGKVSRMIRRLKSRDEKEETKREPEEELPKPKSVLTKIAMFERQEPDTKPKPYSRDSLQKLRRPSHDPSDYKPKIIDEVLKPVQRRSSLYTTSSRDQNEIPNEPKKVEENNNTTKIENFRTANVEFVPISASIVADDIVIEEAIIVNEVEPKRRYNNEFPQAKNTNVKTHQKYEEVLPINIENTRNILESTPVVVDYVGPAKLPDKSEPQVCESKAEIEMLTPVEVEYIEPAKPIDFESDVHEAKNEIITINHEDETVQYDTFKRKEFIPSPFDFTPKADSHRIKNYDDDFNNRQTRNFDDDLINSRTRIPANNFNSDRAKSYNNDLDSYETENYVNNYSTNETPSLDYVLDRLSKYKSSFEDTNLKKSKSVAELDLGDAVKGKVHDMIVRMKSVDKLNTEKREVISAKERPRKKSVSEKIALFEGKLSISTSSSTSSRSHKPAQRRTEDSMSPEELQTRLAELNNAKLTYGRMTNMTYLVLGNGREMPVLSTGTALLNKHITAPVVATAIDLGYRGIDAAFVYGNEKEVGEGIRMKIQDGTVTREDLFIINKLWSTFHRQDLVETACRRSLDAMGLEYFDLYLIHNPMSFKEGNDPIPTIAGVIQYSSHDYLSAWYGMEQLVVAGLVRSIGVSNFNSVQLQRVLERARVKPVVNMVESHPYLSQQRLNDFCTDRNVTLFTYGVLGSKGTPEEYKSNNVVAIDDPLIQVMAAGLGVTPAQLLIRYQIESGHAVVTKATTGAHLWDNLQALTFSLTDAQMEAIRALNRNKRIFTFKGMGDTHKNYPFNIAF